MKKLPLMSAMVIVASTCVVTAQQQEPTLKPTVSPKAVVEPTRLLLKIVIDGTGYGVGTPAVTTIHIRSAVFDDLSFEGNFRSACSIEWSLMGQRFWLKASFDCARSGVNEVKQRSP